jgi:hypothetical protein
MNIPICVYGEGSSFDELNADIKAIYDALRTLSEGNIDGYNLSEELFPASGGLELTRPTQVGQNPNPPQVIVSITNTMQNTYFRRKGNGKDPETFYGMECVIDITNTTYGRFCIVNKSNLDQQVLSLYTSGTDGIIDAPVGDLVLRQAGSSLMGLNGSTITIISSTKLNCTDGYLSIPTSTNGNPVPGDMRWDDGASTLYIYSNAASDWIGVALA